MTVAVCEPVITLRVPDSAGCDAAAPRRALFLDRDGVINVNHGYVHTPEHTDWVPGIFELARAARGAGYALVVVTNQAGIARGYYSDAQFREYTRWMHERFDLEGAPLLATYYCPHHPDAGLDGLKVDCDCRKPKPGMLLACALRFGVDLKASVMLGDKPSDAAAAQAAGVGRFVPVAGFVPPDALQGLAG